MITGIEQHFKCLLAATSGIPIYMAAIVPLGAAGRVQPGSPLSSREAVQSDCSRHRRRCVRRLTGTADSGTAASPAAPTQPPPLLATLLSILPYA